MKNLISKTGILLGKIFKSSKLRLGLIWGSLFTFFVGIQQVMARDFEYEATEIVSNRFPIINMISDVAGWLIGETALIAGNGLVYLLSKLAGHILVLEMKVFTWILHIEGFVNMPVVQLGWRISRDISYLFYGLIFVAIAFGIMLRLQKFGTKKMIIGLLAMAILINFSLTIGGIIIDFSQSFFKFFLYASLEKDQRDPVHLSLAIGTLFDAQRLWQASEKASEMNKQVSFFRLFFILTATVLYVIVIAVLIGTIFVANIARYLLLIIAPIAWTLSKAPGEQLKNIGKQWWGKFINYNLVLPALAFFIFLALQVSIFTLGNQTTNQNRVQQQGGNVSNSVAFGSMAAIYSSSAIANAVSGMERPNEMSSAKSTGTDGVQFWMKLGLIIGILGGGFMFVGKIFGAVGLGLVKTATGLGQKGLAYAGRGAKKGAKMGAGYVGGRTTKALAPVNKWLESYGAKQIEKGKEKGGPLGAARMAWGRFAKTPASRVTGAIIGGLVAGPLGIAIGTALGPKIPQIGQKQRRADIEKHTKDFETRDLSKEQKTQMVMNGTSGTQLAALFDTTFGDKGIEDPELYGALHKGLERGGFTGRLGKLKKNMEDQGRYDEGGIYHEGTTKGYIKQDENGKWVHMGTDPSVYPEKEKPITPTPTTGLGGQVGATPQPAPAPAGQTVSQPAPQPTPPVGGATPQPATRVGPAIDLPPEERVESGKPSGSGTGRTEEDFKRDSGRLIRTINKIEDRDSSSEEGKHIENLAKVIGDFPAGLAQALSNLRTHNDKARVLGQVINNAPGEDTAEKAGFIYEQTGVDAANMLIAFNNEALKEVEGRDKEK